MSMVESLKDSTKRVAGDYRAQAIHSHLLGHAKVFLNAYLVSVTYKFLPPNILRYTLSECTTCQRQEHITTPSSHQTSSFQLILFPKVLQGVALDRLSELLAV